jgi:3'-phosphoadenosine 5'-phosphosulfate sulfotransferase (PAPS reductase)/FAD synthetase
MPKREYDFPTLLADELSSIDLQSVRRDYGCVFGFALFSGGHDSLTATSVAFEQGAVESALHIDTGIGVPETRDFVERTCKDRGWPLRVYSAEQVGESWEDFVRRHGFPGPAQHNRMYNRLKERALRAAIRDCRPPRKRVLLVSGCRSSESVRRMGTVKPVDRQGTWVWSAVIHNWSKQKCLDYLDAWGIKRNPVVERIGKSGECLCGAFAKPGELDQLHDHYPEVAERILDLEQEVRPNHPWGWEDRRPDWVSEQQRGQSFLCDMTKPPGYLCYGCHKNKG